MITNKHVVEDCQKIEINIHLADNNGKPYLESEKSFRVTIVSLKDIVKYHETEDLCAINIGAFMKAAKAEFNLQCFAYAFSSKNIPTEQEISSFEFVENVYMVGYPLGLMDTCHNLPIVRKGITATKYSVDCENKPIFLADIAILKGSSGSPVFMYKQQPNVEGEKLNFDNKKLYLLGVNKLGQPYALGYEYTEKQDSNNRTPIFANLAVVVKSKVILDLLQ